MIALAVDNSSEDLKRLCEAIKSVHPEAQVVYFVDPMLAFKYSITHSVDLLYTAISMKRMNGFMLEQMMRKDHPHLIANYVASDESYKIKSIQYLANSYVVKPVSAEKLRAAELEVW